MDINQFKGRISEETNRWTTAVGSPSRAFLKWFLVNYFRIDEDDAIDYICDNTNDKGIDGIYVDNLSSEIFVFQAKYSPTVGGDQGDKDLRNFAGVRAWFESPANINSLNNSIANQELKALVIRLELSDKILKEYKINLIFITNKVFDINAKEYINVLDEWYEPWDLIRLFTSFTYPGKDKPVADKFKFEIDPHNIICRKIIDDIEVIVFAAKAEDLVQLKGIQDQSLFDRNVRYGLGKTRINREIAKTIKAPIDHPSFLLFNNGITIICEKFNMDTKDRLEIENYSVVNGCQTVITLYENKAFLDDKVRVFTKAIKTGNNDVIGERITYYNNNQNAISPRDLKSTDKVQQDIQKQIFDYFTHKILYNIKRGEPTENYDIVIPNDFAAQMIASFILKEPYITHQKTELFADNYQRIFSRHINAPLIYLLWKMYTNIDKNCLTITNPGVRDYKTTRFFIMYLFREIFDKDELGSKLLEQSQAFYENYKGKLDLAFDKLSKMLVIGFNNFVTTQEDGEHFFDYKNILRNEKLTKTMARDIISKYDTALIFQPEGKVAKLLTD